MFGISPGEFIVLAAVAAVVLGPERLPEYAQSLARVIRELRRMAQGASAQVRDELGPEFDDIDWRKLDPRQYDPRRIVREALADVWDPDDPLGLNQPARDQDADFDDLAARASQKPTSPGGPAEVASSTDDLAPARDDDSPDSVDAVQAAAMPQIAFDPDAT